MSMNEAKKRGRPPKKDKGFGIKETSLAPVKEPKTKRKYVRKSSVP